MRSTTIRAEQLPLEVQQQIDACCDKFELALRQGKSPTVSDLLKEVPTVGQPALQRELAAIELAYLRTQRRTQRRAHQQTQKGYVEDEGLHLRCPHCQNHVELLDDAKLEEITCNSCGDTFSLIDEDSELGASDRIAHFELLERLGTGGFGTVWKARDTELDRLVAIKLPRKSQLSARETEQFIREARTAAQLKHPNIVPVHEVGKEDATIFIVTDLIEGITLSDWLKEQTPTLKETAEWCATLAETLAYAHQQGIIHRDLKPSNVMLDEQLQLHLMDFGLAKRELAEITMTIDGTVLGTPAYMSPEQALGESHWIDRRTDVYSLGVMLFQMLTQELPYRGTAQQQIQQRVIDDAPDPRKLNALVPPDLATICLKCLERSANRRYATVGELAAELRRYLAGEPIRSRPISGLQRLGRWAKRKPALATAAVLTGVLAIAGPIAAVVIQRGQSTIRRQLQERNAVILRNEQEKTELSSQLQTLRNDLESFQQYHPGRVELAEWRERFIAGVVESHHSRRGTLLEASSEATIQQDKQEDLTRMVRSNLGWVYLLRASGKTEQALEHAAVASKLLNNQLRKQPESLPLRLMLANCLQEMSELQSKTGQGEAATQTAIIVLALRKKIANEHPNDLTHQINQFEAQGWQLAQSPKVSLLTSPGESASADGKRTALATWQQTKNNLQKKLATTPDDLYTLACYLTLRQPQLRSDLAPVPTSEFLEQNKVD